MKSKTLRILENLPDSKQGSSKIEPFKKEISVLLSKNYSYRQISEILSEFGLNAHFTTIQKYAKSNGLNRHFPDVHKKDLTEPKKETKTEYKDEFDILEMDL